jgi:hypothetical protein
LDCGGWQARFTIENDSYLAPNDDPFDVCDTAAEAICLVALKAAKRTNP